MTLPYLTTKISIFSWFEIADDIGLLLHLTNNFYGYRTILAILC